MALGIVMLSPPASADICGANGNPVVYVTGSSAVKGFMAALGRVLYNDTMPITIVYKSSGSCLGVSAILNGDPLSGNALYWDPASTNMNNEVPCTIGTGTVAGSVLADVGVSDVFPNTCFPLSGGLPMDVDDFFGPVQTMTFVVPHASNEHAISAAAAYFVFGFGVDSGVAPWTQDAAIFRRNASSGTQNMIAKAIGAPAAKWKGIDAGSTGGVVMKVTNPADAQATIGIMAATDITDTLTLSLRPLAYKHYDQSCAYLPDSGEGSKDKKNVRDGHYAIWGPLHFLAKLDMNRYIKNPNARRVVNYITGSVPPPGNVDLIQLEAVSNVVPTCAMGVKRTTEMGQVVPFAPLNSCGCYFDQVSTGHSTCTSCMRSTECPSTAPNCSYGYCERQ
jgi:hypothetical protein